MHLNRLFLGPRISYWEPVWVPSIYIYIYINQMEWSLGPFGVRSLVQAYKDQAGK